MRHFQIVDPGGQVVGNIQMPEITPSLDVGDQPVGRPLSAEDMGPSWAEGQTESSCDDRLLTLPERVDRADDWLKDHEWRLKWLENRAEAALWGRFQSRPPSASGPTSESHITAEEQLGETPLITVEAGLAAFFTWTPTGIICTIQGTIPLPQQDRYPPGDVEST